MPFTQPAEEQSSERSSTSSLSSVNEYESNTTANGDGLILNRGQKNIFEMIAAIKNVSDDSSDSDTDKK